MHFAVRSHPQTASPCAGTGGCQAKRPGWSSSVESSRVRELLGVGCGSVRDGVEHELVFGLNLQHLIEEVATAYLLGIVQSSSAALQLQGFAWSTRWLGQAGQDHGVIESLLAQLRKVTFQLLAGGARA